MSEERAEYYAVHVQLIEQGADDEPRVVYAYTVPVDASGPAEARETAKAGVYLAFGEAKLVKRGRSND